MTERTDHSPDVPGEETLDRPVMDGAEELRAEAQEAVESGKVDLTDTRHGGPSVVQGSDGDGDPSNRQEGTQAGGRPV